MTQNYKIAIVLVNYRGASDTIECIESILKVNMLNKFSLSITIVDNNSPDDSLAKISNWIDSKHTNNISTKEWIINNSVYNIPNQNSYVELALLQSEENMGYAGGVNAGLRFAKNFYHPTHYWILNNDTVVDINALIGLLNKSINEPNAIYGSTLVYYDNPTIIQAAGGAYFIPFIGRGKHINKLKKLDIVLANTTNYNFDYIIGAAMFFSSQILDKVGLMPEEFFLYCEEVEWCKRAQEGGVKLLWAKESIVIHKEGRSTGATSQFNKLSDTAFFYMTRSSFLYTWQRYRLFFIFVLLFNIFLTLKYLLKGELSKLSTFIKALKSFWGLKRK